MPETMKLEPCPFCNGKATRKEYDDAHPYEAFGLIVDHKPECFLAMAYSGDDDALDAAWNRRPAQQTEPEIWPDHLTGACLGFEGGLLNINRDGSGNLAFAENDLEWEQDDESGKDYRYVNIRKSEFDAIRDFLDKWFPRVNPPHTEPSDDALHIVADVIAAELSCTYDCSRVWEAWSYGTMGPNDFEPASERAEEIAAAVLDKLKERDQTER
ncbi:hypothetical protein, partial [Novosphingobium sp. KN65.2]|uniref:hypothetical protein n=1 Tax=Novosphingobium sp. KN65.2 TaxID=1478134 RepID=UPI000AA88F50